MTRSSATRLIVTVPARLCRAEDRETASSSWPGALDGRVIEACLPARAAFPQRGADAREANSSFDVYTSNEP